MTPRHLWMPTLAMTCASATAIASPTMGSEASDASQDTEEHVAQGTPPPPPPAYPDPPPPPYMEPPQSTVSQGILDDAASSGMWIVPTALMAPAGTWTFEDNELSVVGGSYAFSDNFAVSAHTLIPLG